MKNVIYITFLGLLFVITMARGQDSSPLAKRVAEAKTLHQITDLLTPDNMSARKVALTQQVRDAQYFRYNKEVAQQLLGSSPREGLSVALPSRGRSQQGMTLDLVEVSPSFYDYVVTTSSGERHHGDPSKGKHYRGVVRGKENESLVALSLYEEEMMGVISVDGGNFNLGKLKEEETHILYNDSDLEDPPSFTCDTPDDPGFPGYDREVLLGNYRSANTTSGKCVRFYFETEYDIYQNKGSVANVESYIMGLYNQVATLYANEQITTSVSELKIWDTTDPYTALNTPLLLSQFQSRISTMNGDLGQLLTFRNVGGGMAAGFKGICNDNIDSSLSVSNIDSTYSILPTYSWSVSLVAHEFGHLFGSRHTHACVWNGNNTAIDGCYPTEGSCSAPGYPSGGGTIMSYCDLKGRPGINFSKGFGRQPGNLIRNRVANGGCLGDCEGSCLNDVTITQNVSSGNTDTQQAGSTLTASNIVQTNASATYSAGNSVVLAPGFRTKEGGFFSGIIEECVSGSTLFGMEGSDIQTSVDTTEASATSGGVASQFRLFPNPTQSIVTIDLMGSDRMLSLSLYDLTGRLLHEEELGEGSPQEEIDLSFYPTGIYLIRVDTRQQGAVIQKIVKE